MALKRADFPLPDLTDERTAEYFAGAARGELVLPRCDSCNRFVWYPEEECPHCGGRAFTWTRVSGRGRGVTWTVVRRAVPPAVEGHVAVVDPRGSLQEG